MMTEARQPTLGLEFESQQTDPSFQSVLDYIREHAKTERQKGDLFERLMVKYFSEDPDYQEQFTDVRLWKDWAALRTEYDSTDIGVDLVAKKHDGTFCAIQCKCYAEDTRISKTAIDSFISASASDVFTSYIIVNTGGEWGPNALRTIEPLHDKFRVIRFADLQDSPFEWPDLSVQAPEELTYQQKLFKLKPHQQDAFDAVIEGFKTTDRGKMIMACGTGKTFTALKIAEKIAGAGGRVLYIVPSIALLSQAMREWSEQRAIPHSYIGICSDTSAGHTDEDASIMELKIPVTTHPTEIFRALQHTDAEKMSVVFCTYQSLSLIEEVQNTGAPAFDIIFCDEAHKTTGVDYHNRETTHFQLVHNNQRIRGEKRLYMTATPRIYTEGQIGKARSYANDVFTMDDEATYGTEFYKLPFSKAVEIGELTDYKVVIFGIDEQAVNAALSGDTSAYDNEININDATKIIGCWRALQNPEDLPLDDPIHQTAPPRHYIHKPS